MKRLILILVPIIAACAGAVLLFFILTNTTPSASNDAPKGKVMSIDSYVTQNISTLSPEKSVLGGTFHVTNISVSNEGAGEGTGVVSYEDGHIALTADFTYVVNDQTGITIKSFKIRN
ncbi:hypothetical protein K8R03_00755 [Candidatus Kaiserbacteria bacterium]|nr:hypothetical protein [Candidatus Kaiserbacteria bacterium]